MNTDAELLRDIRAYLEHEPDPDDRRALLEMLDEERIDELRRAFASPIEFGTAGLRARCGPGPSGMNLRNVLLTTRALLEVLDREVPDARARGIVIGNDARPSSPRFARAARDLATSSGFVVHAFDEPTPTPLVAFAANTLGAAAALVLTASHNPAADNGMKVYGPAASLLVPPWDVWVSERIHDGREPPSSIKADPSLIRTIPETLLRAHRARSLAIGESSRARSTIRVAYSALHGVGARHVEEALDELGCVELVSVASQREPDGTFPTAPSPNPELAEALVEVLALAKISNADLVLANDPDADRIAVGVGHEGDLVMLHGDEIGVLLGATILERSASSSPLAITTIVSSPWLMRLGDARGKHVMLTLTGHKWIHALAATRAAAGESFVFGYEEALGFAFDNGVRDKDGVAGAIVVARIATESAAASRTLIDELEAIAREIGLHRSAQISLAFADEAARERADAVLASLVTSAPKEIGGRAVEAIIDGRSALIRRRDGSEQPLPVPPSSLVGLELENGARVLARASGTEPKLKLYLDLRTELRESERYLDARRRADDELRALEPSLRALFD